MENYYILSSTILSAVKFHYLELHKNIASKLGLIHISAEYYMLHE